MGNRLLKNSLVLSEAAAYPMKSFHISTTDLSFLLDQVNVPIVRVVAYTSDGQPI